MTTAPKKQRKENLRIELLTTLRALAPDHALFDAFLLDLLTPGELDEFTMRWQIVKLLASSIPQREVARRLNVSIATVTRGYRTLRESKNGFSRVLGWREKKLQ